MQPNKTGCGEDSNGASKAQNKQVQQEHGNCNSTTIHDLIVKL